MGSGVEWVGGGFDHRQPQTTTSTRPDALDPPSPSRSSSSLVQPQSPFFHPGHPLPTSPPRHHPSYEWSEGQSRRRLVFPEEQWSGISAGMTARSCRPQPLTLPPHVLPLLALVDLTLPPPHHPHVPPAATDLLVSMLADDPDERLSAKMALSHPFIRERQMSASVDPLCPSSYTDNLRNFNTKVSRPPCIASVNTQPSLKPMPPPVFGLSGTPSPELPPHPNTTPLTPHHHQAEIQRRPWILSNPRLGARSVVVGARPGPHA